ncbi:hypothetical protein [Vallicoccus soli]|uniref:hypothetical protein n=1 Tax=Vallicoccus soli TaxID=2339232 RepID=UPI001403A176|nr:hypothetical protein [Vallicoccus soli]
MSIDSIGSRDSTAETSLDRHPDDAPGGERQRSRWARSVAAIAAVTLVGAVLGALVAARGEPAYVAETEVVVTGQLISPAGVDVGTTDSSPARVVATQAEVLRSEAVRTAASAALGADAGELEVSYADDSNLLRLSATSATGAGAQRALAAFVDAYEQVSRASGAPTRRVIVDALVTRVGQVSAALPGATPAQRAALTAELAALNQELARARATASLPRTVVDELAETSGYGVQQMGTSPAAGALVGGALGLAAVLLVLVVPRLVRASA